MTRTEIAAAILLAVIVGATFLLVAYLPQVLLVAEHHPVTVKLVGELLPMVSLVAVGIATIICRVKRPNR